MGDRLSAERACKDPNPIIDGRKANVNLAILGAKPRGNLTQGKKKPIIINNIASHCKKYHRPNKPMRQLSCSEFHRYGNDSNICFPVARRSFFSPSYTKTVVDIKPQKHRKE